MALKLIIDNTAVRTRMSLPDLEEVNAAIDSAIQAAHVFFEARLGTVITQVQTRTDVFYLDANLLGVVPNNLFRLRLRQAFLTGVVSVGSTEVVAEMLVDDYTDLATDLPFKVNLEKGLVYVDASYNRSYVGVTYTAGFDTTHKAPIWLQEAMLSWLPSILNTTQPTNRADEAEKAAEKIREMAGAMVDAYKRETALQLLPIF